MLVDMHCHTRVYSACSALTPEALARAAQARGLDAVVLTEHDALWPLDELQRLSQELSFTLLRGVEATTEVGHVLVYGLHTWTPVGTLADLRCMAGEQDALIYLAHPGRSYGTSAIDIAGTFASVEAHNGTEGALQDENAAAIARRCTFPGIGGSDAHSAREVGVCATRFDSAVCDDASLIEALNRRAYQSLRLLSK